MCWVIQLAGVEGELAAQRMVSFTLSIRQHIIGFALRNRGGQGITPGDTKGAWWGFKVALQLLGAAMWELSFPLVWPLLVMK